MKKRRMLSALLAVVMLLSMSMVGAYGADSTSGKFTDIEGWYKEYIVDLTENGVIKGKTETTFEPKANITRAEFVAILARMSKDELAQAKTDFKDVDEAAWYAPSVAWAYNNKIVLGYEGEFNPLDNITRQDMAVILMKYAAYKNDSLKGEASTVFADDAAIADYAKDAVYKMQSAGLISGKENNNFDPKAPATRGECAKIVSIYIDVTDGVVKTITILQTTDLHGNIIGFSYEDNKATTNNGMARVYSYVQQVRSENPNTLLVDNGDTIQGTIMTDDIYNKQDLEHPVIAAMNFMKYDAMTLGNHEFNFGIDLVDRIIEQAKFPVLAANASYKADNKDVALNYTMIEKDGVKIAVIGLTNPNVPRWDGEKVDALQFADMAETAKDVVAEVKDKADIIVAMAHSGLIAEYDEEGGSDSAAKIIELSPEIDALMLGHTHTTVDKTQGNTIIGGARNLGREVIRYDFDLDENNEIVDSDVTIVDMAGYVPSEEIVNLPIVKEAHQKTLDYISGGVANSDGTTSGGTFGKATATFQPVDEIKGIPEGKLRDTAVMDLINKVQLLNSGADVSAAALFKDTSDVSEGEINYGTIFNIYKFDNTLYRVKVTGAELKTYMEWSAECYNQWVPGDISISFNPEKPGYLYDMFAGVDYKIDLSKPAGQRITDVMFKGAPLKDDQELTLAVNNYRYSSALKANNMVANSKEWESPNSIRDMLVQYITDNTPISPEVDNNWEITGVDLSSPYRDEVIKMVNDGLIESPYGASLNVDKLKAEGIIK